jgi:hypothetical protein
MLRGDTAGEKPKLLRGEMPLKSAPAALPSSLPPCTPNPKRGVCNFERVMLLMWWVMCAMGLNNPGPPAAPPTPLAAPPALVGVGCVGGMADPGAAAIIASAAAAAAEAAVGVVSMLA